MRVRLRRLLPNPLRFLLNAILNRGEARYIVKVRVTSNSTVHQISGKTKYNRYPEIFKATVDLIPQDSKILSFGCSTGEEVMTLRKYFPHAKIVGAKVNRNRLKVCQSLDVDDAITFVNSEEDDVRKLGPYNAIFCMAVLQRSPGTVIEKNIQNISKFYPFEKFSERPPAESRWLRVTAGSRIGPP